MSRSVSFSVACSRTPWEYIPKKMAEPLVPLVMRLSGDGGTGWGLETLQSLLQARKTRLTDSATELHEALKKLSPKTHALGLCHVLSALWSEEEVTVAFNATLELLERCEAEQIQQCPVEFTSVTRAAVAFAIRGHSDAESEGTQQESTRLKCMEQATPATSELCSLCSNCPPALRLLKPLRRAVQKFRKDAHEVTSSDTDFLRLCVHGQWYKEALPVIDREAYRVHKVRTWRAFFVSCMPTWPAQVPRSASRTLHNRKKDRETRDQRETVRSFSFPLVGFTTDACISQDSLSRDFRRRALGGCML